MSFTKTEFTPPERFTHFAYYASGGEDGAVTESLNPDGGIFKLMEIRLHLSIAFTEVEDFVVRLSAAAGSAHNLILLSQALSDLTDVLWQPDRDIYLLSDDQVVISWSQASGANTGGLTVTGWGVYG